MIARLFSVGAIVLFAVVSLSNESFGAKFNRVLDIGDAAPVWTQLPGVDDRFHRMNDYQDAKLMVLAFTCNHCPVAKMYEDRFIGFAKAYKNRGVEFVAINCGRFPADRLKKMKQRAKKSGFGFDYLYDPTQMTGREYGATVTPQLFVLNEKREIAYMGAFDDSMNVANVSKHYVTDAIDALLAGKKPEISESRPVGCRIEYGEPATVKLEPIDPKQFPKTIAKHRGKVVLVDFWATWCFPCLKAFPQTVGWSRKYADDDLVVISVSIDEPDEESKQRALRYLKKRGATFSNYISSTGADESAFEIFDIASGLPHFKIYDRDGNLLRVFDNADPDKPIDHEDVEAVLRAALGREPVSE